MLVALSLVPRSDKVQHWPRLGDISREIKILHKRIILPCTQGVVGPLRGRLVHSGGFWSTQGAVGDLVVLVWGGQFVGKGESQRNYAWKVLVWG